MGQGGSRLVSWRHRHGLTGGREPFRGKVGVEQAAGWGHSLVSTGQVAWARERQVYPSPARLALTCLQALGVWLGVQGSVTLSCSRAAS